MTPQFNYFDWRKEQIKEQRIDDCWLSTIAIEPQVAVNILESYLLGPDWFIADPLSNVQANTSIVENILLKYSPRFRRELKKLRRENKRKEKERIRKEKKESNFSKTNEKWKR